jgi:hypothetical protein
MARPSWVGRGKAVGAGGACGPGPTVPASGRPDDRLRAQQQGGGHGALRLRPPCREGLRAGASGGSGRPLFIVLRFNFCLLAGAVLTWVCAKNQILPVATLTVSMNHGSST